MSKSSPYARISLTLPPEVLAQADRVAGELERSRSWVIAEAIRRWVQVEAELGGLRSEADVAKTTEELVAEGERDDAEGGRPPVALVFRDERQWLAWKAQEGRR